MSRRRTDLTSAEKGAKHDDLMPLLVAMFREFQEASKKKPDGVLNKRKVEIVNRLLRDVMSIVEGEATRAYLDLLDEDDFPQNSDVALIIGQAVAAMETFKAKYYGYDTIEGDSWAIS
jgi:hypothetical protein